MEANQTYNIVLIEYSNYNVFRIRINDAYYKEREEVDIYEFCY